MGFEGLRISNIVGAGALGVGDLSVEGGELGVGRSVGGETLQIGKFRGKQNAHRQAVGGGVRVGGAVGAAASGEGALPRIGRAVGEGVMMIFATGAGVGKGVGRGVGNGVGAGVGIAVAITLKVGKGVGRAVAFEVGGREG